MLALTRENITAFIFLRSVVDGGISKEQSTATTFFAF